MTSALVKTAVFLVVVPGAVVGYVPYRLLGGRLPRPSAASWIVAAPLLVVGAVVLFRCMWDFATAGRGTPAPFDPPGELVVRGFYRYVRNPMYVAVVALLLGEAVLFRSRTLLAYAAVVALFFTLFVVLYEQPTLEQKFGESYRRYRREVPAWFPRLPRRSGSSSPEGR